jgi:hypothetical protein
MKITLACAAALLALTACSAEDPAPTTGPGDAAAGTQAPASVSASSGAAASKDDQEAVRKVIDTAVDAANLGDPGMLDSVLCEPSGPTKSDKLPADAFVNIQEYPAVDGDEVQVDLEIAVPGGESSAGKLIVARKGDGWCVA